MKRQMFFATAFSAALAVGAAAQTGTGTGTGQTPSQQQSQQQVTMTGCLEKGAAGTAGTTGTTAPAAGGEFILSNASPGGAPSGTAGTAGTEPGKPPAGAAMGSKYKLQGGDREDLEKYLNSKVEIRGTLDRSSMGAPGTGTGTGTGTSTASLPTLKVSSVRQIAKTCEGGN